MLQCYGMEMTDKGSWEAWLQLEELLPAERLERLHGLHNEERRRHFLMSGLLMQYGISAALGIPICNISYIYGKNGKPYLAPGVYEGGQIDFNLSHSGRYAVLAVSDTPVGIDVECSGRERLGVAKRFFCPEEYEDIQAAATPQEKSLRFASYWTMKEAYVKRTGEGLMRELNSFYIRRGAKGLSATVENDIFFATLCHQSACIISICSENRKELEALFGNPDQKMSWIDAKSLLRECAKEVLCNPLRTI